MINYTSLTKRMITLFHLLLCINVYSMENIHLKYSFEVPQGMSLANVFAALYDHAQPQGFSLFNANAKKITKPWNALQIFLVHAIKDKPINIQFWIDYVRGKLIKTDFSNFIEKKGPLYSHSYEEKNKANIAQILTTYAHSHNKVDPNDFYTIELNDPFNCFSDSWLEKTEKSDYKDLDQNIVARCNKITKAQQQLNLQVDPLKGTINLEDCAVNISVSPFINATTSLAQGGMLGTPIDYYYKYNATLDEAIQHLANTASNDWTVCANFYVYQKSHHENIYINADYVDRNTAIQILKKIQQDNL